MIHMRPFTPFEEANIEYLVNKNIEFTQLQITRTGIEKSYSDATVPMRAYFKEKGVHDYSAQGQGPAHKIFVEAHIIDGFNDFKTKASMYRPVTKEGDPRICFYGLYSRIKPDDIFAIIAMTPSVLVVIDITRVEIQTFYESVLVNPIQDYLTSIARNVNAISQELLGKLMAFKGHWLDTLVNADTGIGREVETLLGIPMNASKNPDYKGIELKSFRSARPSIKKGLFSQVPDWDISKLKSGRAIVDKYGYYSDGIKRYSNTLKCEKPNSQNLRLNVNYPLDLLEIEEDAINPLGSFKKIDDVAVWRLQTLHSRLLSKHHETFWIEVNTRTGDSGQEQFQFNMIEHTRNPLVSQFDVLLEQSLITVDLLFGRPKTDIETGARKSGGDSVLFKIQKKAAKLLFPETQVYTFA